MTTSIEKLKDDILEMTVTREDLYVRAFVLALQHVLKSQGEDPNNSSRLEELSDKFLANAKQSFRDIGPTPGSLYGMDPEKLMAGYRKAREGQ